MNEESKMDINNHKIRVVELFAGVGGFRIGLEGASDALRKSGGGVGVVAFSLF